MISKIESGISTYIGHFQELIGVCETFGAPYNPSAAALKIAGLKSLLKKVEAAVDAVDAALSNSVAAENARSEKFTALLTMATRIQAVAISLNLPNAIMVHVKEVVRKIRGQRAKALKLEAGEEKKHISVSQVSFNEQIEHMNQLLALVSSQAAYTPLEADLTVAGLKKFLAALRSTNTAAVDAATALSNARQERDRLLYTPQTGMMDTALTVKEYVKAIFGASSPQYKKVKRIKFHNR